MKFTSASDIGLVRSENQDNVYVEGLDGGVLAVLCDGMGGESSGSEASTIAVEAVKDVFTGRYKKNQSCETVKRLLELSVAAANSEIYSVASADAEKLGMGTTCVAAFVTEEQIDIINVGDSRAYIFCDSELVQITFDHTLVNMLISQGKITPDEAKIHPHRNMLVKAVGVEPEVKADCFSISIPEDTDFMLMLCSDGLSGCCSEEEIKNVLINSTFEESADRLIKLAIDNGGRDNVTVAIIAG